MRDARGRWRQRDAGAAERARDLLSRCERARYAGGGAAVADLATDASALVDALEAAGLRTKGGLR